MDLVFPRPDAGHRGPTLEPGLEVGHVGCRSWLLGRGTSPLWWGRSQSWCERLRGSDWTSSASPRHMALEPILKVRGWTVFHSGFVPTEKPLVGMVPRSLHVHVAVYPGEREGIASQPWRGADEYPSWGPPCSAGGLQRSRGQWQ